MNLCKICNKYFQYSTSILPYDICPKCYSTHVTIEEFKPTKEELIKNYQDIIDICLSDNEKHYRGIKENRRLVKHYNYLLTELLK